MKRPIFGSGMAKATRYSLIFEVTPCQAELPKMEHLEQDFS